MIGMKAGQLISNFPPQVLIFTFRQVFFVINIFKQESVLYK